MQKSIFLVFALFAVAFVAAADSDSEDERPSHHELWGNIGAGDKLIRRDVILADPAFTGKAKKVYNFPSSDTPALFPYSKITAVKVIDQYTDGYGGKAKLLAGGPDSRDVSLQIKSQIFRGLDNVVEIWGQ